MIKGEGWRAPSLLTKGVRYSVLGPWLKCRGRGGGTWALITVLWGWGRGYNCFRMSEDKVLGPDRDLLPPGQLPSRMGYESWGLKKEKKKVCWRRLLIHLTRTIGWDVYAVVQVSLVWTTGWNAHAVVQVTLVWTVGWDACAVVQVGVKPVTSVWNLCWNRAIQTASFVYMPDYLCSTVLCFRRHGLLRFR